MKRIIVSVVICMIFLSAYNTKAQITIAEKLGFDKDAKLLIVHADDAGMCNSENLATEDALISGAVSSTSIMMPCPWADDFIAWALKHPEADIGIHLTLTAEWEYYRWKGVLPSDQIPTLLDKEGYFPRTAQELVNQADLKEVEAELRAQIDRAIELGLKPSHLDSHMATTLQTPELIRLFLKLGKEYRIPNMLSRYMANKYHLLQDDKYKDMLFIDNLSFLRGLSPDKWDTEYRKIFKEMKPGLNQLILHAAFDNLELQSITVNHTEANSVWRQRDYNFVKSRLFRSMLKEYDIHVITWREVQKVLFDDEVKKK